MWLLKNYSTATAQGAVLSAPATLWRNFTSPAARLNKEFDAETIHSGRVLTL